MHSTVVALVTNLHVHCTAFSGKNMWAENVAETHRSTLNPCWIGGLPQCVGCEAGRWRCTDSRPLFNDSSWLCRFLIMCKCKLSRIAERQGENTR